MNPVHDWRDAPTADFAVIGDPITHSLSPQMHQVAYTSLGMPYRYVAIHVSVGEVSNALDNLKSLGYRGVNATVPHKAEALKWASHPDSLAQRIGAANTLNLIDRTATNTDGPGFLDTLASLDLSGNHALILGAGGSARAIAAVLPQAGFEVSIWNRSASRAEELAAEFGLAQVDTPCAGFDLLINTTSASLSDSIIPVNWSLANSKGVAYDLVYGQTPFLRQATQASMKTLDGKALLVAQGARSFEWWLGVEAPRQLMTGAIQ